MPRWSVSSDVVDFDEAIEFFRRKSPALGDLWAELDDEARAQAFTVAGVAQLDLVTDVYRALDSAIAEGLSLEDFKSVVGDELEAAWGGTVRDPGYRVETIFRTNVQSAYAAGRYAQMTDPGVLEDRPYWTFEVIEDGRECDICGPCDGTTLEASSPWWASHHPLLHHSCRCEVHSLTADDAKKRGVDARGPHVAAADGFGAPPRLNGFAPSPGDYPHDLWEEFLQKSR